MKRDNLRNNRSRQVLGVFCALAFALAQGAEPAERKVELSVDGAGWLRNREFRLALERLLDVKEKSELDANAIEDAAVILSSSLNQEGFQKPTVTIEAELVDGANARWIFDPTFGTPLPRPIRAAAVRFNLQRGLRYQIDDVTFNGLSVVPPDEARAFFRSDATLVGTARTNAFSASRVSRAADALLDDLRQRGYAEADVRAETEVDDTTGRVDVRVEVKEGQRWEVTAVTYNRDEDQGVVLPEPEPWVARPWTSTLQEDIGEAVRQAYYEHGYPDVGVHVAADGEPTEPGRKDTRVVVTIVPGPQVKVGEVQFRGNSVTRQSVLRRRVRLDPGDLLNPVVLERGRFRISRLGVFESVDLRYEPAEGEVRDVVYVVREGPRYETSLLMGYGSYEQLRGGIEYRQMNILGMAHQSRLELVQSMKSTSADYTYSVPELFGESLDGTARLFGLRREEIAFDREEYGVDLSLRRPIRAIGGSATAGYSFEALRSPENVLATQETDETQVNVASVFIGVTGDRRDNPLRPRHGYHWATQIEAADPTLGGEATYQRLEISGAYHTSWGRGRWIHVALSHGVITTFGASNGKLPVARRFYPGGDNSVRGYQRGEAAPRGEDESFIGAKGFLVGNLELEQALTPNWSVVAFADALGTAVSLRDYPFEERLYSVGLGVRFQTLIGPIRLEYGHNLNPRPGDPSGTWHFAIGYPF